MRKLDPSELYELEPDRPELDGPVLVQALEGFIDAGGARKLASTHLLDSLESQIVARFDVDQLFDYRARRPVMVFAKDHWEFYDAPVLAIHLLRDQAGTPFLLLAGPEPDVQWERFVAAVQQVCAALGVRRSIGLNAIPMGLPHTRPVGVIAHGSPRSLVEAYEPWVETVQVPASAGHLLELRPRHWCGRWPRPVICSCRSTRSTRPPPPPARPWTRRLPPPPRSPRSCTHLRSSTTRSWPAVARRRWPTASCRPPTSSAPSWSGSWPSRARRNPAYAVAVARCQPSTTTV
mgnify:CR=1 FL=1